MPAPPQPSFPPPPPSFPHPPPSFPRPTVIPAPHRHSRTPPSFPRTRESESHYANPPYRTPLIPAKAGTHRDTPAPPNRHSRAPPSFPHPPPSFPRTRESESHYANPPYRTPLIPAKAGTHRDTPAPPNRHSRAPPSFPHPPPSFPRTRESESHYANPPYRTPLIPAKAGTHRDTPAPPSVTPHPISSFPRRETFAQPALSILQNG